MYIYIYIYIYMYICIYIYKIYTCTCMILTPRQCRTSSLPTDNSAERWIAVTHASNSHEATGRQPASTRTWPGRGGAQYIYLYIYLSIYLSEHTYICLSFYIYLYRLELPRGDRPAASVHKNLAREAGEEAQSIYISIYLSMYLYIYPNINLSIYLYISPHSHEATGRQPASTRTWPGRGRAQSIYLYLYLSI